MYSTLLVSHSAFRWLVLGSLLFALYRGLNGWLGQKPFARLDNTIRHSTATITHIQLMIGYTLYFYSPLVSYFRAHFSEVGNQPEFRFFGWIHIVLMTLSVLLITIGSAAAKRQETDSAKFKTMTIWYAIGLLIILAAIPWPFSPLASRPYFRSF
ncbi:hypothetical protein ACFPMF_02135 [Larkinella bovis]|uniref:Cytochrome B n=1 Tax=Larkinella bovis TaxID=683041 RepID=A0ABW0I6E9_9BACT